MTSNSSCTVAPAVSVGEEVMPTWPPDTFGRRRDTAVKALVPFSKQPVDHFPFLIHHKSLNLIHIGTPVVSLKDKHCSISFFKQHIKHIPSIYCIKMHRKLQLQMMTDLIHLIHLFCLPFTAPLIIIKHCHYCELRILWYIVSLS